MQRHAAIAGLLLSLGIAVWAQQKPEQKPPEEKKPPAEELKIPTEEANRENPVKLTPASLAQGKHLYGIDCAMCHGEKGDGKGDLAATMNLNLSDFRDPAALKKFTDGEIFYIITKGKGEMTGEGDRLRPNERWDLVNYVRSFARKEPAPKPPTEKP